MHRGRKAIQYKSTVIYSAWIMDFKLVVDNITIMYLIDTLLEVKTIVVNEIKLIQTQLQYLFNYFKKFKVVYSLIFSIMDVWPTNLKLLVWNLNIELVTYISKPFMFI